MRRALLAALRTGLPAAIGLALLVLAWSSLGARPGEIVRALALWAMAILPVGALLTGRIAREVWTLPVERLALAALVGLPVSSALGFLLAVVGADALLPGLFVGLALAWVLTAVLRRRGRGEAGLDWAHPANGFLLLLAALAALVLTRGFAAFEPQPSGALLYRHSMEQAIHTAFSWELLRGVPAAELPTAAGLRFPHYHVLGYLPLTWPARWAGIGLLTVHHAFVPPLAVMLVAGGAHLAVKARTGRDDASVTTLLGLLFVVSVAESVFVAQSLRGRVPLEFLVRSPSVGGGILLFVTVAALLAAMRMPHGGCPLLLAAALVGLSYGVKAQMFLMLGGAFVGLVLLLSRRGLSGGQALLALAGVLSCAAPLALSGRGDMRLGRPHLVPGLFVWECGFGALFADLGPTALWLLGSPLALWAILRFSPFVPAFTVSCLRRWRTCPPVDLFVALGVAVALFFSFGLAAEEIQRGEVSTLVVREALFAVQVLAVGVDVGVLAWLLGRAGWDGARAALRVLGAAALALFPLAFSRPLHRLPPRPLVLSRGEVGALEYLRQKAPFDAVVAHLRPAVRSMPLVAAFAGRRAVLEYYRPDVDPSVNRLRALRRLFATKDAAEGEALLDRFSVDYVLERRVLPLRFESPRLRVAYERDKVRLWLVTRDGAAARPRPPLAHPALR